MSNHDLPDVGAYGNTPLRETELGPLPQEWEVVKLGEVCEKPQYGYTAPATKKQVGPKMLRITDIQDGRVDWRAVPYCECSKEEIEKYALHPGDIVFARTGSVGKAFLISQVPERTVFASYLIRVRVSQGLESEYLYFFMQSSLYWQQIASQTHGAVQPNVNATQLKSLLLPLPPLPEQRAIAQVLRTVQQAKEATERVIAAARELKKSLMRHLFTCGPVPLDQVDRVRLKETEIGPVPEGWEVVRLGEVVEAGFSGGTPSTKVPSYWDGEIPWTTSAVIAEDDVLLSRYQKTISREALENSSSKVAPRGSLIVGTRVGVGKAVVTTFDIAMSQDLTALILNRKVEGLFLAYSFKAEYLQKRIQDRTRGTTIKGIPRRDLLGVLVTLPPLPEQRAIAEMLRTVDRKIEAEERRKAALDALFKTLLHHLMTGKVRVAPGFVQQFNREFSHE